MMEIRKTCRPRRGRSHDSDSQLSRLEALGTISRTPSLPTLLDHPLVLVFFFDFKIEGRYPIDREASLRGFYCLTSPQRVNFTAHSYAGTYLLVEVVVVVCVCVLA